MKSFYVDSNSRITLCAELSIGINVESPGVVREIEPNQIVRIKAKEGDAVIRLENHPGDGVLLSEGETEYFFIERHLELVSGKINVMY